MSDREEELKKELLRVQWWDYYRELAKRREDFDEFIETTYVIKRQLGEVEDDWRPLTTRA